MKKIISIICVLSLILGCVPQAIFANENNISVNESFDNIATNDYPQNVDIKTGMHGRVVQRGNNDKALHVKADDCVVKISIPVNEIYDKTVYSCDIMIEGDPVEGVAMKLNGGTSTSLLAFAANRSVSLDDGMRIHGYSNGMWNNYTFCVDYTNRYYDLYINGDKKLSKRLFLTAPAKNNALYFELSCPGKGDTARVYLDNIYVCEGMEPLKTVPSKGYNSEELPYDETNPVEKEYDAIFIDSNSNKGLSNIAYVAKTGSTARWSAMEEGGEKYVSFEKKNATNDCYADISVTGLYEGLDKYVYQTDIYIEQNESYIIGGRVVNGDGMSHLIRIDNTGNLTVCGTKAGKIETGRWVTIAVAVDIQKSIVSVYIDGELTAEEIELVGSAYPEKIRIGLETDHTQVDSKVYFNRIKLYDGNTIRTFLDGAGSEDDGAAFLEKMKHTDNETDEQAHALLGTDIVFMTRNGKFYANGKKQEYKDFGADAYLDGNAVMVDTEVLKAAANADIKLEASKAYVNSKEIPVKNKDGVSYVNATDAGLALGRNIYDADNRGFVILSTSDKGYHNSLLSSKNQESIDLIWRYMQFDRPDGNELYNTLKNSSLYKSHPRLLVKKDEIPALKSRVETDSNLRNALNSLLDKCDTYFEKAPQKKVYQADGFRTFSACYEVKTRLFDLCTAYILTGAQKYADRAWLEVESTLNWEDWNLDLHYLDSGELVSGMAFAYDVLYDYMTQEQKQFFRDQIEEKYLDFCVGIYTGDSYYKALEYRQVTCNWGAVCGASMYMAATTLMDEDDENSVFTQKCKYIAANAMQTFEHIVTALAPEGTWFEGLGYYEYVQQHLGWFLEASDNIFGNNYNFLSANGVEELSRYIMYLSGIEGVFNYNSITEEANLFAPEAFIYAKLTNDAESMKNYNDFRTVVNVESFLPQYLLFYDPTTSSGSKDSGVPLDKYYSTAGVSSMRESWQDPSGLYLGMRSGQNAGAGVEHSDKGSFVFESGGVRWSLDMGRNGDPTMDYLYRTETHSALVINPTEEHIGQTNGIEGAEVICESKPKGAYMIYDLSGVYSDWTDNYKRGFLVSDDRQTVTVRDEVSLKEESNLVWNMITRAHIEIAPDGKSAVLKQDGKTLNVTGYCSATDWSFEATDDLAPTGGWKTDSKNFTVQQQKNFSNGVRKLVLKASGSGKIDIAVKLAPADDDTTYSAVENISFDNWTIPDGEIKPKAQADMIYADGKPLAGFVPGKKAYTIDMVYGSPVPHFTADVSYGEAEIVHPKSLGDDAVITVTTPDGHKAVYKISFHIEERIVDAFINTAPQVGLPGNTELLTISSVRSDHEPQPENAAVNVADGSLDTRWSSDRLGSYVEVDLGDVYDLSGLALAFSLGDSRNYKFDILVSENKIDYKRVYSGYSMGGTLDYEYMPMPCRARYVRYIGYQHKTGEWNSITEVRPVVSK